MAESMDEGITALESADEEGAEYLDKHDKKSVGEYDDGREVAVGQETATANAFDALLQAAEGAADRIAKTLRRRTASDRRWSCPTLFHRHNQADRWTV